jgi:colanic acid biosynthesis glycosyl transferase WcaI
VKILIVTQYFWPENFRINDLAEGLRERGHGVTVYTGLPNYPQGRFFDGYSLLGPYSEDYRGVRVIRTPLVPRGRGGGLRLMLNYASHAFIASLLAPLRCPRDVDVVLVYEPSPITIGIPARVIKWCRKTPVAFWVQDLWPQSLEATGAVRSRPVLRLVDRLVRWIYRGCDRVLVQSRAFVDPIRKQGVAPEDIRYLPNSAEDFYVPTTVPEDAPERAELPAGFKIMFAGNIGAAQDFSTILEAAERLREDKEIHWIIVGDGRLRSWVDSEIVRRGLQGTVHLLGHKPPRSMPRILALADALLVTLRREPIFALTIPSKIQSYLACARPVLAALDGEGARIIRESGAGLAVPTENPAALADAVRSMAAMDGSVLGNMGRNGYAYFERNFARGRVIRQLEELFAEMVESSRT